MAQLHSSRGKLIAKSSLFSSMLLGLELLALHFSEPLAYYLIIKDKKLQEVEA